MKKIVINNDNRRFNISSIVVGYLEENKEEVLEFEIPEKYAEYGKKACFSANGQTFAKNFDDIISNKLTITRDISQFKELDMTIEFFKIENEDEVVARTSILHILIENAIICDDDVKPDEPKIIILDKLIDEVRKVGLEVGKKGEYANLQGDYAKEQGDYANSSAKIVNKANEEANRIINNFETNVGEYTTSFNENANNKTTDFDSNTEIKTRDFNQNVDNKISEYNNNATSKLNDYNTNASTKLQEFNTNADNKIAEYDLHSQELDNKIIDTRNELERVKNDVLETGTDSDTYIHLEDSAMAEYQELSVDGVCKQETTQGYNVLDLSKKPYNESSSTLNGATITENGGILTVDTTNATDIATIRSKWEVYTSQNSILLPKGSYYTKLILNVVNLSGETKGQLNRNFTLDEDCLITQWFYNIAKGQKDVKLPLLVSNDQTKTEYEPFTGGQPSPSPDYPQEIKTIENSLKITSCNKNLYSRKNGQYNVPIYATDGTSASYQDVNVVWVKVKPNTAYTFTLQPNQQEYYVRIIQCDSNKGFIVRESQVNSKETNIVTTTKTTRSNCEWLQIGINQYVTAQISNNNWKLMIEENSVATTFEQHLETQITANLPEGEFIGKINDTYKDTLKVEYNEEDGQYHLNLYKRVYKNNSYNGEIYNYYISTTARKDGNIECGELQTGQVVYYVGDETIIDLGVVDMPITYNEITNLFTDSNLLPQINAKYYRNFISTVRNLQVNEKALKQELVDINARLSSLENANTNVVSESEVV